MDLCRRARRGIYRVGTAHLPFFDWNELPFALRGKAHPHRYIRAADLAARILLRYPPGGRHNIRAFVRFGYAGRIARQRHYDGAYKRGHNRRLARYDADKRAHTRGGVRGNNSAHLAVHVVAHAQGPAALPQALFKARRAQRVYRRDYNGAKDDQGLRLRRGGNIPLRTEEQRGGGGIHRGRKLRHHLWPFGQLYEQSLARADKRVRRDNVYERRHTQRGRNSFVRALFAQILWPDKRNCQRFKRISVCSRRGGARVQGARRTARACRRRGRRRAHRRKGQRGYRASALCLRPRQARNSRLLPARRKRRRGGDSRSHGRGQNYGNQPFNALLRRRFGHYQDRRKGHNQGHARISAQGVHYGFAGYLAVFGHHIRERGLRQRKRDG